MPSRIWSMYTAGGWVMHPITVCSVLAVGAIFYKFAQFNAARLDLRTFLQDIRSLLLNGKVKEAIDFCAQRRGPVPAMVHAGLLKHGSPPAEVEQAMETAALFELSRLERYLGLLATVVNVAPLLGFFGTVWGMILAFDVIYRQGLGNPALAARGISQALYTTAWGLIVAFVTLPFHNWFAAKVAEHGRHLEMTAGVLQETFAEMDRMGTKA